MKKRMKQRRKAFQRIQTSLRFGTAENADTNGSVQSSGQRAQTDDAHIVKIRQKS